MLIPLPILCKSMGDRCKYELEYPDQPLLKGYRLLRAGNYVRRRSAIPNGQAPKISLEFLNKSLLC